MAGFDSGRRESENRFNSLFCANVFMADSTRRIPLSTDAVSSAAASKGVLPYPVSAHHPFGRAVLLASRCTARSKRSALARAPSHIRLLPRSCSIRACDHPPRPAVSSRVLTRNETSSTIVYRVNGCARITWCGDAWQTRADFGIANCRRRCGERDTCLFPGHRAGAVASCLERRVSMSRR
jgi:hypothetical protein